MNRDELVLAVAAVAFVAGLLIVRSGWHVRAAPPIATRPGRRTALLAAVATAAVIFAVSGWMVPSLVVAAIVGFLASSIVHRRHGDGAGVERTEALASWIENVRDVLQSGNQPVGAIGATTHTCPPLIRAHVVSLFARLSAGQPADVVFRRFADDLDDPLADLVAVGLLIAVSRGAETEDVLSALAAQARHQADRRRIVEAERAPMRREVWMVSAVMCALLALVFVFSRSSYLNAFDRSSGQAFLTFVLAAYGALVVWVARLATFPRPARFLNWRGAES
jgi:tight adherence protein B